MAKLLRSITDPKLTKQRRASLSATPRTGGNTGGKNKKDPTAVSNDPVKKAARQKHLNAQAEGGKTKGDIKAQLKARLADFEKRVASHDKSAGLQLKLLEARKAVQLSNLKGRQTVSTANAKARLAARRKALLAKKPVIKDNKIVVPKVDTPKYTPKQFDAKPLPRIVDGKIVKTAPKKQTVTAGERKAGQKGARTRAKSGKKDAS